MLRNANGRIGFLWTALWQSRTIATAIQQFTQQRIRVVLALGGGGDHGRHGRRQRDENRLRMRELADFGGSKSDAFAGGDEREQRAEVLDVVSKVRRESGSLAAGADSSVASGKFLPRSR